MRKTQNYLRDRIVAALGEEGVKLLIQDLKRRIDNESETFSKEGRHGISYIKIQQLHEMQKLHSTWGSYKIGRLLGISSGTVLKYGEKRKKTRKLYDEQIEVIRIYREEHPEASLRALSRKFGVAPFTIKRYLNI